VTPVAGFFTLYGGTITGVSAYSYVAGTGFAGDKSARITITFTASVANPVLAWGGHISSRADWGANNSAVAISGSPYHTRLIDLDGSGGNQDRSLSAAAVIFPAKITIIKDAVPNDPQNFSFSTTGGLVPSSFTLDDDNDPALSNMQLFAGILVTAQNGSNYTITETAPPAGWAFTPPIDCEVTTPNGGSQTPNGATVTINLREGENVTCTYTNTKLQGTLVVIKHVVNDNGGSAGASDFTMSVIPGERFFAGAESPGTSLDLDEGSYTVDESGPSGYTKSYSGDCNSSGNVAVVAGQTKTCTITNDDQAPQLTLVKQVTNDNGGNNGATEWTLTATGDGGFSGTGTGSAAQATLGPNAVKANVAYALSESGPSGYTASGWSCEGGTQNGSSITLGEGQSATCTITNDDNAPSLTLNKVVVNDNGGTAAESAWTLTANGGAAGTLSGPGAAGSADVVSGPAFKAGTYALSESGPSGYAASAWSCVKNGGPLVAGSSITLANGDSATCTITNDDQPPPSVCLPDKIYAVDDPGGLGSAFFNVDPVSKAVSACGPPREDGDFESLESKNGVLYTISAEGQSPWIAGGFYRLDSNCGLTYVGHTGYRDLEGLAVRITDGTMWAVVGNDTGIEPKGSLVTINDVTTGVATLASRVSSTRDIEAIAWSRNGQVLYGADGDNIYKYDFGQRKWIFYADTGISEAIEGMDIDHVKSQQLGVDVLILGPHNKSTMYYWRVDTKVVIGTLATGRFEDIEGIATCRVN
jgi:hypothetical protein